MYLHLFWPSLFLLLTFHFLNITWIRHQKTGRQHNNILVCLCVNWIVNAQLSTISSHTQVVIICWLITDHKMHSDLGTEELAAKFILFVIIAKKPWELKLKPCAWFYITNTCCEKISYHVQIWIPWEYHVWESACTAVDGSLSQTLSQEPASAAIQTSEPSWIAI